MKKPDLPALPSIVPRIAAGTKQCLEGSYAPYRLKRRTKAQIAREAGVMADALERALESR